MVGGSSGVAASSMGVSRVARSELAAQSGQKGQKGNGPTHPSLTDPSLGMHRLLLSRRQRRRPQAAMAPQAAGQPEGGWRLGSASTSITS